jgi:hypothetical protein
MAAAATAPTIHGTGWDYFAISITALVSLFLLAIALLLMRFRRDSIIKKRNVRLLLPMCVCCFIWIWSVTIADEHDQGLHPLRTLSCSLWSFWGELMLGGNAWLTLLMIRVNIYYWIFVAGEPARKDRWNIIWFAVYTVPMLVISVAVSALGASYIDESTGLCRTQVGWKIAAITVAALNVFGFVCFAYMLSRGINKRWQGYWKGYNENREYTIGIAVGLVGIVVAIMVNISGQTDAVYGRVIRTLAINMTVLVFMGAVCGRPLWKVLAGDQDYDEDRTSYVLTDSVYEVGDVAVETTTFQQAMSNVQMRTHFRFWMSQKKPSVVFVVDKTPDPDSGMTFGSYGPGATFTNFQEDNDDAMLEDEYARLAGGDEGRMTEVMLSVDPLGSPVSSRLVGAVPAAAKPAKFELHAERLFGCLGEVETFAFQDDVETVASREPAAIVAAKQAAAAAKYAAIVRMYITDGAPQHIPTPDRLFHALIDAIDKHTLYPSAAVQLKEWIERQLFEGFWEHYINSDGLKDYAKFIRSTKSTRTELKEASLDG